MPELPNVAMGISKAVMTVISVGPDSLSSSKGFYYSVRVHIEISDSAWLRPYFPMFASNSTNPAWFSIVWPVLS